MIRSIERIMRFNPAILHTAIYGICIAVTKGISLFMLPFIVGHLSVEEFGRLEVVSSLAILGSVLVGFGLEDALFRFCGNCSQSNEKRRISANLFLITWCVGVAFLMVAMPLAYMVGDLLPGDITSLELNLTLLIIAFEGIIAVPLGWLRMQDKAKTFFIIAILRVIIQVTMTLVFLNMGQGVVGVLFASLLAVLAQALCLSVLHLSETGVHFHVKSSLHIIKYCIPLVFSGIVGFGISGLDRWVLAEFGSMKDLAVFGVAMKLALGVVLLLQPFQMWWNPRRFSVIKSHNGQHEFVKNTSIGIFICAALCIAIASFAPICIAVFLPGTYLDAIPLISAIVVMFALKESVELINFGCMAGPSTQAQFWINLVASFIAVFLLVPFTLFWGVGGVIAVLTLCQIVRLMLFYHIGQKYCYIRYPIRDWLGLAFNTLIWLSIGALFDAVLTKLLIGLLGLSILAVHAVSIKILPWPNSWCNPISLSRV